MGFHVVDSIGGTIFWSIIALAFAFWIISEIFIYVLIGVGIYLLYKLYDSPRGSKKPGRNQDFDLTKFLMWSLTFAVGIFLANRFILFIEYKDPLFLLLFSGLIIEIFSKIIQKINYHKEFIVNKTFLFYVLFQSLSYYVANWIFSTWIITKFDVSNEFVGFGILGLLMSAIIHLFWKSDFNRKKDTSLILVFLAIIYLLTKVI